ncbi:glycoside hydrolase family 3 N-terminal domain-containing protein [Paenibacillus sp. 7523-1]|uniref:glycoside hydrolase family 3 N-terminal domain-containing protein n=1 Tax=Paenibacillus sp. 7523-1 TaxID=2022550 RepID=UPI001595639A|nr:glycoside hydrolase family 3 N-terminal domain-containing protein [Paenibacillus sp. 7523-1]
MTLNQKVRQLTSTLVAGETDKRVFEDGIGEIIVFSGSAPAREVAAMIRSIQDDVMSQTEFSIPALIHAEALSGAMVSECAVFPTSISLGATFSPELVEDMADRIRKQMVNLGIRQALSPVLDLARDFRFGRTSEDYGNDPTLVSAMACAFVSGLQGQDLREGVAATAKHFIGYSMTEGGLNGTRTQTDWKDIRENFSRPFEAAIRKSNLKSVMNSYSEYNGQPICASKELLTDLLRDDLGFDGVVVSDYTSINNLVEKFATAEDPTDAAIQCLTAGLDVELPTQYGYGANLREAVLEGKIDEYYIDRSLERMLRLKFELGLFDNPYGKFMEMDNSEHDKQSAYISDKVLTLTKNTGILPLMNKDISIAVIGPTGDNLLMLNGAYSYPANSEMFMELMGSGKIGMEGVNLESFVPSEDGSHSKRDYTLAVDNEIKEQHPGAQTIFEALQKIYSNISYVKGCHVIDNREYDFKTAVEAAAAADIVIMTVGGKIGMMVECSAGEGRDNVDITLPGRQAELVREVFAVNKNMIVIHTDNKPLVDPFIYENVPAILEGWLPGPFGGNAIAKAISGITNPGGKLPVDVPRHVGQTPVYFYQPNGSRSDALMKSINPNGYGTETCASQLPFGYGLSYTEFEYSDGKLEAYSMEGIPHLTISINVANIGDMDGDEVVQLYGIDKIASVVRPQKELIGFKRITLKAGETKKVELTFRIDQLAFQNRDKKWVVEKGLFSFFIGKGSNDAVYEVEYNLENNIEVDYTKRGFFAETREISSLSIPQ